MKNKIIFMLYPLFCIAAVGCMVALAVTKHGAFLGAIFALAAGLLILDICKNKD